MPTVTLSVWGMTIRCESLSAGEILEIEREFHGCVRPTDAVEVDHTIVRVVRPTRETTVVRTVARHRGGSSGRKFFVDGSRFEAAEQRREVGIIFESDGHGVYDLNGALCVATPRTTTLVGDVLGRFVVADVVENWLLCEAKRRSWLQCHAAGWVADGGAHLVVGSSGAGKTTQLMAAVRDGGILLGNDRLFLRVDRGRLQVRGFPLPVNVGCGTIRAVGLRLPHLDKDDGDKIRLTAREVTERFEVDYERWWDVLGLSAPDPGALEENLYWDEDECHPHWNVAHRSRWNVGARRDLSARIEAAARFGALLAIGA